MAVVGELALGEAMDLSFKKDNKQRINPFINTGYLPVSWLLVLALVLLIYSAHIIDRMSMVIVTF
jgi:hypothetical protein